MQGFLSRDGMRPADLLAAGRAEVRSYGVDLIDDQVVEITSGFTLRLADALPNIAAKRPLEPSTVNKLLLGELHILHVNMLADLLAP